MLPTGSIFIRFHVWHRHRASQRWHSHVVLPVIGDRADLPALGSVRLHSRAASTVIVMPSFSFFVTLPRQQPYMPVYALAGPGRQEAIGERWASQAPTGGWGIGARYAAFSP